jgi:hypothetical protein
MLRVFFRSAEGTWNTVTDTLPTGAQMAFQGQTWVNIGNNIANLFEGQTWKNVGNNSAILWQKFIEDCKKNPERKSGEVLASAIEIFLGWRLTKGAGDWAAGAKNAKGVRVLNATAGASGSYIESAWELRQEPTASGRGRPNPNLGEKGRPAFWRLGRNYGQRGVAGRTLWCARRAPRDVVKMPKGITIWFAIFVALPNFSSLSGLL